MKLSVIIPTRLRPDLLLSGLESLWQTTRGYEVETIVIVDNDPKTYKRLLNEPRITMLLHNDKRVGAIKSWNMGATLATGDIFTTGSDDVHYEPDWLKLAYNAHQNKLDGYGLVAMNSYIHDINIQSGGTIFDRKFCKDHMGGVMYCPHYRALFADKEVDLRAKRAGRFYPCPLSVVLHLHPCESRRKVDANDKWRDRQWTKDETLFNKRELAGFPDDFEPVI